MTGTPQMEAARLKRQKAVAGVERALLCFGALPAERRCSSDLRAICSSEGT